MTPSSNEGDGKSLVTRTRVEFDFDTAPSTGSTWKKLKKDKEEPERLGSIDLSSMSTSYPVTNLDFDVTENCNLGCLYCFKGEMYSQSMSLDVMKRTFEWLLIASRGASNVNCNFMGGEPTMRFRQIREFVPWARRRARAMGKHATFSMTTNLTLFTDEIRAFVDLYGFGVLMSIDGCPEVQDAQRPAKNGRQSSELVGQWARSMLQTRPKAQARATVHPNFVDKFAESVAYIHGLGFREMAVSASEYQDWTESHFSQLERQLGRIVEYIDHVFGEGGDFCLTSFKYYISRLIRHRVAGNESLIKFQSQPCGAGKGYLMVDYQGDIWPCHRFDGADTAAGAAGQFRLGNIFKPGFNYQLQGAFLDFDHGKIHKESCNVCPVNPVCGGYCPAANLSDTGSIYSPHDAFCRWSNLMYGAAFQLHERICKRDESTIARFLASCREADSAGDR
jgi:uncharacterized protein